MSVTSRASTTTQRIHAGPADQYVKLAFDGQTEFPTEAGETLVIAWISSDAFPARVAADALRKSLIDATRGTSAWDAAVEAALAWLLRPPLVRVRADRHPAGEPADVTERHVFAAPLVGDLGLVYIAGFHTEEGELVSVEVAKDPASAVDLNFRELKIWTVVPKVEHR
jgi:hypothetical protein